MKDAATGGSLKASSIIVTGERGPEVFISSTGGPLKAPAPALTVGAAQRLAIAAQAATKQALAAYLGGESPEGELETVVRAEAEARLQLHIATARAELEQVIGQMMNHAREQFRRTASLRNPRPYAKGRG